MERNGQFEEVLQNLASQMRLELESILPDKFEFDFSQFLQEFFS